MLEACVARIDCCDNEYAPRGRIFSRIGRCFVCVIFFEVSSRLGYSAGMSLLQGR
jgi:hypothetical protein